MRRRKPVLPWEKPLSKPNAQEMVQVKHEETIACQVCNQAQHLPRIRRGPSQQSYIHAFKASETSCIGHEHACMSINIACKKFWTCGKETSGNGGGAWGRAHCPMVAISACRDRGPGSLMPLTAFKMISRTAVLMPPSPNPTKNIYQCASPI